MDAEAYLASVTNYETMGPRLDARAVFRLDRVRRLAARLGDPHEAYPSVHVAGTKGKGSTCAMIEAVLRAAGARTGLFTSPHLLRIHERIRVDGAPIGDADFERLVAGGRGAIEAMRREGDPPTFFEIIACLAFRHFADADVAFAVTEVGLGGALDATNILVPHVAALTSISMDHMHVLGDTLEGIAKEKAGILKPGVPAVCAPQAPEAARVVAETAARVGAPCWRVGDEIRLRRGADGAFDVTTPRGEHRGLRVPLAGAHQAENAAVAVGCLDRLCTDGELVLSEAELARGLAGVAWPGRMEIVSRRPTVVLDGAQNRASAHALAEALGETFPGQAPVLVLAMAADKDLDGVLAELAPRAPHVVCTRTDNPRAADPADLAARARALGAAACETAGSPAEALSRARELAGPDGLVCAAGSLYLCGALMEGRDLFG